MESPEVITALLAKRAEIEKAISGLQKQMRKLKTDLTQIDATIKLFSASVTLAKREATQWSRSVHFVTGELTRRCQTALREAEGRAITADEVAVEAMREKGLEVGDGALRQDITRRFLWTLNRMLSQGTVAKQGWGAAAKWVLPVEREPG